MQAQTPDTAVDGSLPTPSGPAPETQEPPAIAAAIAETAPLPRSELAPAADPGIEVEPAAGTSSPAGVIDENKSKNIEFLCKS